MKTKNIILVMLASCLFFISCDKNSDNTKKEKEENVLSYVKTKFGACNWDDLRDNDGVVRPKSIITISEDTINVFVGFVYAVKLAPFETQIKIIDDVMCMYIIDTCDAFFDNLRDCYPSRGIDCYSFDFIFKYQGEINQKYKILMIDPDPLVENPYILSEGIINSQNR